MKNISIGVIGTGYWGPNIIRNVADLTGAHLYAVCDRRPEQFRGLQAKYPSTRFYTDSHSLLKDSSLDAVAIATPVSSHYQLAREALRAGKHTFVEKPLCMYAREARELVSLAKKNRLILMVGHTFLYSPPVQKIKQMIDQGTLGKIYYMNSSRVNLGLFQPDVSVFRDLAPHDLSMFLYWSGKDPLWVSAEGSSHVRSKIHEVGFATLGFPGGVMAHLHVSWLAPSKLRMTTIVGSKRMVLYDDTSNNEKVKLFDQGVVRNPETFGEFQLTYRSGDILSPHLDAREPLKLQMTAFVESIRTGKPPINDGRFGARVVRVLEALESSSLQKGKRISLS